MSTGDRRPVERWLGGAALACLMALLPGAGLGDPAQARLETVEERFSYGIGAKLGRDLLRSEHEVDADLVRQGLDDALAGRARLDEGEVAEALAAYGERQRERLEALQLEHARKAQAQAQEFLARNRERPGVVALDSGLQYEVLEPGEGASPEAGDFVTCHYRGKLLDGQVFDDTYARGEPRTFVVTSLVDGLEQALQLMQPGARWKVYVPPDLAYGAAGFGREIPPHAALVFELELLAVVGPDPTTPAQGG